MAISLASLSRATALKPPRILIHGVHGVGKTTFAADAPEPVFILTEDGLGTLDVPHFPLARTFDEVMQALAALYAEEHRFRTLVMDSADWLEPLVWARVCKDLVATIDDIGDVVITAAASGQMLRFNGASWVNEDSPYDVGMFIPGTHGNGAMMAQVVLTRAVIGTEPGVVDKKVDAELFRPADQRLSLLDAREIRLHEVDLPVRPFQLGAHLHETAAVAAGQEQIGARQRRRERRADAARCTGDQSPPKGGHRLHPHFLRDQRSQLQLPQGALLGGQPQRSPSSARLSCGSSCKYHLSRAGAVSRSGRR
jgi:hypothetical protein